MTEVGANPNQDKSKLNKVIADQIHSIPLEAEKEQLHAHPSLVFLEGDIITPEREQGNSTITTHPNTIPFDTTSTNHQFGRSKTFAVAVVSTASASRAYHPIPNQ